MAFGIRCTTSISDKFGLAGCLGCGGILFTFFCAWVTHIVVCIQNIDRAHEWMILVAGAIAFPVGIIHGMGYWFGIFTH